MFFVVVYLFSMKLTLAVMMDISENLKNVFYDNKISQYM